MFFPRLRRQAKWAFAVMIVVFGLGFVLLGVGSGGLDLGSLLQDSFGRGGSSGPSISKAQEKVNENPRSASARRELAQAYRDKGQTPEAIASYQQYLALRPKDTTALAELAQLQVTQANSQLQQLQIAYLQQSLASASSTFGVPSTSKFGKALGTDPIGSVVETKATTSLQQANTQYSSSAQGAIATYKKLAKVAPTFDHYRLLATSAQQFQDTPTALEAYKQALKRTNDPSLKAETRAAIKSLQSTAPQGAGG
jgi:tetratricopeptide (TPR) repeat protein